MAAYGDFQAVRIILYHALAASLLGRFPSNLAWIQELNREQRSHGTSRSISRDSRLPYVPYGYVASRHRIRREPSVKTLWESWETNFGLRVSAIRLVRNPEFHHRTKHIDVKYHFIRDQQANGKIDVRYVATQEQLADMFTKPLAALRFKELKEKIGVKSSDCRVWGEVLISR